MASRILAASARRGAPHRTLASKVSAPSIAATEDGVHEYPFTAEHRALQRSYVKLIEKEINPFVDDWEAKGRFPAHEVFKKLGAAGFLGLCKPVADGGAGLDYTYSVAAAEALGSIMCGAVPMAIGVQTDMATPALARFGNETVRAEFLRPSIAGDKVACLGVSEVGAGSDVASVTTRAVSDGDDLVITGGKMWTTNGAQADWMCCLANTSDDASHSNKSLICVPMKAKGVTIARTLDKVGLRSSDTAQVFLDGVRVPKSFVIGDMGSGFKYQMLQFQEERLWGVANCLQPLEFCINSTLAYAQERIIFGKPLVVNQAVRFRLAELATEVEALRSLLYRAVAKYCAGEDVTMLASMAKLKAGRLSREVPDACMQYWGGMGYMNETPVTRKWRDMRIVSIGGGADEVMMEVIAKCRGIAPLRKK